MRVDASFRAIPRHALSVLQTRTVLSSNGAMEHLLYGHGRDGAKHLGLFVANDVRVKGTGRLHGHQGDELEDVVGDHVAQGTRLIVIAATHFHTHLFGDGNLHMVNVAAIPGRLKNAIGKTQGQNVLDGFFPEIMVDPIDLIFAQFLLDFAIQRFRRGKVTAKRLFYDHASPAAFGLVYQTGFAQLRDYYAEEFGSNGKIVQKIAASAMLLVNFQELFLELAECGSIVEVAAEIIDTAQEPISRREIAVLGEKSLEGVSHLLAKILVAGSGSAKTENGKFLRQQVFLREVVEGRKKLSLGQVAAGAKHNHQTRAARLARGDALAFILHVCLSNLHGHIGSSLRMPLILSHVYGCA